VTVLISRRHDIVHKSSRSHGDVGIIVCAGRSVLTGFSSEQELGLVASDVGDGGEDVSTVYGGAFHAVAVIDAAITCLAV